MLLRQIALLRSRLAWSTRGDLARNGEHSHKGQGKKESVYVSDSTTHGLLGNGDREDLDIVEYINRLLNRSRARETSR